MTVRRVEIRLTSTGFSELSKNLDEIDLKLDKLKAKFDDLSKKVISPKMDLRDVTRADAEIDRLSLKLDAIGHKRVTAHVGVNVDSGSVRRDASKLLEDVGGRGGGLFGRLGHLFGRGGKDSIDNVASDAASAASGGGGVGGGLLSMIGGANNSYFGALIAALIGTGAAISPAMIPFLGGLGSVAGTGLLAGKLASANPKLPGASEFTAMEKKLEASLMPAPMVLKPLAGLMDQLGTGITKLQPQLASLFTASMPSAKLFIGMMLQAAKIILPSFTQALKELKPELPTLMKGFVYLAQGVATFMKNLGPGMKDSAIIFKGLMAGVGDVLGFLGRAFSDLANYIVKWVEAAKVDSHQFAEVWDKARHDIAVIFDGMRHDIAHIWDSIWNDTYGTEIHGWHNVIGAVEDAHHEINNILDGIRHDTAHIWDSMWNDTIGAAIRFGQQVETKVNNFSHDLANIFDGARHEVAHIWDFMWSDLINAAVRFGHTVEAKIDSMAHSVYTIVDHLPGQLYNIGKSALSDLQRGMESVWGSFWGWVKSKIGGLAGSIEHFFHMSPPHPGSVFYDLGANLMHHLEAGIKSKVGSVTGAIHGSMRAVGGSAAGWIEQAMNLVHAPKSWLPALERLVSLESGGNPRAVDSIPVGGEHATGLWQMLPSTFAEYSRGGSLYNPVSEGVAALDYIKSRYGTPFAIPGLMSGSYQGYWKGGWVNEPVMGLGMHSGSAYSFAEHGREYVSPGGSGGGGGVYNIYVLDPSYSDEKALQQIQSLKRYRKRHGNVPLGFEN